MTATGPSRHGWAVVTQCVEGSAPDQRQVTAEGKFQNRYGSAMALGENPKIRSAGAPPMAML